MSKDQPITKEYAKSKLRHLYDQLRNETTDDILYYIKYPGKGAELTVAVVKDITGAYHRGIALKYDKDVQDKDIGKFYAIKRALAALHGKGREEFRYMPAVNHALKLSMQENTRIESLEFTLKSRPNANLTKREERIFKRLKDKDPQVRINMI